MLRDPLLLSRYERRTERLQELAEREARRTRGRPKYHRLALMYRDRFRGARTALVDRYNRDLVGALAHFQSTGHMEIATCAATHALLPLLLNPRCVRAQISLAVEHHERMFGRKPRGIWLPECAYEPGLDDVLRDCGIEFFFTESNGIAHGRPRPQYGVFAPVRSPSGVFAFGRDPEASRQVWSATEGYPGDPCYRDFHEDIGFELDYAYLRPYLHGGGARSHTGIKYSRITGPSARKRVYEPDVAARKVEEHAADFVKCRSRQAAYLHRVMARKPVLCAPYDAELFGHWWFEGPQWLEQMCRRMCAGASRVRMTTPVEYLDGRPEVQTVRPAASTWGWKGYSEIWLAGENDWIQRHLYRAGRRMCVAADESPEADGLSRRALNQAARELLLAQQSDWPFMIKAGTMVAYARGRAEQHLSNVHVLLDGVRQDTVNETFLSKLESRNNIFPDMEYRVFGEGASTT
jgi:1,4-alpha-glucan branching enzyme